MSTTNGSIPLSGAIRVADLRAYLLAKGWKVKPFRRHEVICFEGLSDDEGQPIDLLVPASEQLRDYPLRVEELLRSLSVLESRPVEEVARNIVTPTADILHLGLDSPAVRTGTLELGFVEQYVSSVR